MFGAILPRSERLEHMAVSRLTCFFPFHECFFALRHAQVLEPVELRLYSIALLNCLLDTLVDALLISHAHIL